MLAVMSVASLQASGSNVLVNLSTGWNMQQVWYISYLSR